PPTYRQRAEREPNSLRRARGGFRGARRSAPLLTHLTNMAVSAVRPYLSVTLMTCGPISGARARAPSVAVVPTFSPLTSQASGGAEASARRVSVWNSGRRVGARKETAPGGGVATGARAR